jgi:hypothetical protein
LLVFSLLTGSSVPLNRASFVSTAKPLLFRPIDESALEDGDIVLRKGSNMVSDLIALAFPGGRGISHCGIVVRYQGGWSVIHSISGSISETDGIRISTLGEFVENADQGKVVHLKPAISLNRELATGRAFHYLKQKVGFDHKFDLEDSSSLYCSELVRRVYLDAGAPDLFVYKQVGNVRLIDMASFFQPEVFTVAGQTAETGMKSRGR